MPIDLSTTPQAVPDEAPVAEAGTAPTPTGAGSRADIPASVDLAGAITVTPPDAPVRPPPYVVAAGVILVKWVLLIMSACVVLTVIWIWSSESGFSNHLDTLLGAGAKLTKEVVDPILKERTDFREFWLKIFQMGLLNVLLPVLTGLLGYIFSSSRDQSKS